MLRVRILHLSCLCAVVGACLPEAWAGDQGGAKGLQGSSGLRGGKGLQSARLGLQGGGGLQVPRIQTAPPPVVRLQTARIRSTEGLANRATLKRAVADMARRELSGTPLEGAATSIPKSQIGVLMFDVAGELERMEVDMGAEAVGYYMAALADPEGERYDEAKRRLNRIFLHSDLSHEEAVRLYDGGLSIFAELSEPRIGLTRDGLASARRDLRALKAEYHRRRAPRSAAGAG